MCVDRVSRWDCTHLVRSANGFNVFNYYAPTAWIGDTFAEAVGGSDVEAILPGRGARRSLGALARGRD